MSAIQDFSEKANFATTSRLLSCLVTESLSRALYFPLTGFEATGFCVLLSGEVSSRPPEPIDVPYKLSDILTIILLKHVPVFKHDGADPRGPEIGLLDPMDMLPLTLEVVQGVHDGAHIHFELGQALFARLEISGWQLDVHSHTIMPSPDPIVLWDKFAKSYDVQENMIKEIAEELESAVRWQKYSYEHPPRAPLFTSSSVEWEQSIVEGHPTHPMHKTRAFLPPMQDVSPGSYDLYHPNLRFVALPRASLKVTYEFEELTQPLREAAARNARQELDVPTDHLVIPVHELQVAHIKDKFKDAIIYPAEFSLPLLAQQSIRSVVVPHVYKTLSLKLGVGIKLTSAVRTISPASAYLGPRFSAQVVPALTMDHSLLTVAKELSSVVSADPESEIAKHCAAIVREAHELGSGERGERLIVCTALVESGHAISTPDDTPGNKGPHTTDVPAVIRVFELDTEAKRLKWLDEFVNVFFKAFLPSVLHNGVAFEAHPQNCLARFDLATKRILGFVIRDFGGIRVHPLTLLATTGVELDAVSGHSIIAPDLDDVYARMYHTVIHNHLQQLIRVLGLHYNGKGWEIVRSNLVAIIPRDHALYEAWLAPERKTFPGKCFMRMRMQGMYRFHLHGPFPNLIHYEGVTEGLS
ncbi:IucC family-domain-containing protein [Lentinula raphanica]|nr:IucC family-domain-containing protein [Lentinula raphanica]